MNCTVLQVTVQPTFLSACIFFNYYYYYYYYFALTCICWLERTVKERKYILQLKAKALPNLLNDLFSSKPNMGLGASQHKPESARMLIQIFLKFFVFSVL